MTRLPLLLAWMLLILCGLTYIISSVEPKVAREETVEIPLWAVLSPNGHSWCWETIPEGEYKCFPTNE